MTSISDRIKNYRLEIFVGSIAVFVGAIAWIFHVYDYFDRAFQFLVRAGTIFDQTSHLVTARSWFVLVLTATILIIAGLCGLVWRLSIGKPLDPGSLAQKCAELDSKYKKASKMLGGMMAATARIRNQLAPAGTPIKSFEYVRITYYIHADLSADVIRAYGIRAPKEPLHFWTTGTRPTSHADPAEYLKDIAFEVKDEKGQDLPYLPIRNDPRAKDVVIYFLPKIEPGEAATRHVEMTFSWPRYLKQMEVDGYEDFAYTLESVDVIPTLEFSYFLEPGTAKNLVGEVMTPRQNGDTLDLAASTTYAGKKWTGFSYKVKNGPAGTFRYHLRGNLETP